MVLSSMFLLDHGTVKMVIFYCLRTVIILLKTYKDILDARNMILLEIDLAMAL
jgi:hypothetical protein